MLDKQKIKAQELTKVTNRALGQLIGAMRQVDYTNTSKPNMYMINGLVRTLAFLKASHDIGLFYLYDIPKVEKIYRKKKKIQDEKIRKLKFIKQGIVEPEVEMPDWF